MNDTAPSNQLTSLQLGNIRAKRALVALWVYFGVISVCLLGKNFLLATASVMQKSVKRLPITEPCLLIIDLAQMVSGIVLAVLILMWIHRYIKNLISMGVTGFRFSPSWAVWCFIIPVLNWFKPYQVMREMWLASAPQKGPDNWIDDKPPLFIMWWFLITLVSQLFSVTTQMGSLPGFGPGWWFLYILGISGTGMFIHLVHELEERMHAKNQSNGQTGGL